MTSARNSQPGASRHVSLLADVSRASNVVAPLWPLTSFVAVNPLGGFQHLPFDEATAAARRWLGARTHLTLGQFRADHRRGRTTDLDLDRAIMEEDPTLAAGPEVRINERTATPLDVVRLDLLHGPDVPGATREVTAGQRLDPPLSDDTSRSIDAVVAAFCAVYVDEAVARWRLPERQRGLYGAWRRLAHDDRRLRRLTGRDGRAWITRTPESPEAALDRGLVALEVDDERRVDELRAQLARLPGWAGYAHWYGEWAPADHPGAPFRMVELLAIRVTIEAAVVAGGHGRASAPRAITGDEREASLEARVEAVMDGLGATDDDPRIATAVRATLQRVPQDRRAAMWLAAQEINFRNRLLTKMSRLDPGVAERRPEAQAAFCIDVRSEGLRRNLESLGPYETLGFAGFFGVPIRWRPLGSAAADARAPVLVHPRHEITEHAEPDADGVAAYLGKLRAEVGAIEAFHAAKSGPGSPFALAEAAGWVAGPVAALRTLLPSRAGLMSGSPGGRRPRTAPAITAESDERSGFSLDERTLFAEAILTTMGLTRRFAPIVMFCGHGSRTLNNPHASSLDCGACGGAPGGASARVAAAILNDPDVRAGLRERGVSVPDSTWFVAAEHDTASDVVTILDRELVPGEHREGLQALERALEVACARHAEERAGRLPGSPRTVRRRGKDWAQVRPEWGLAGNAAFVVGPRSLTADLDLADRVFLHSYDAEADPDGIALETILTAPLVVGQWISAQYYFSTVDPEVFGAGDKTLHNPVGGIGVLLGQEGDLQVGLPTQSVSVGDRRMHEPLRLLAVIQAPLERTEAIIQRNSVLRELIGGSWIHVAGRSHGSEPWSIRSPGGTWNSWWPADEDLDPTDVSLEVP